MNSHQLLFPFAAVTLLFTQGLTFAQAPSQDRGQMLVSAQQLSQSLGSGDLVVLDVRSKDNYREGHVPGAHRVDIGVWKGLATSPNGLNDSANWSKLVGEIGVTSTSHVVVYGDNISNSARIWWLLKYVGVKNVALLDGGWDHWTKANLRVEPKTPTVAATEFVVEFQTDRVADLDEVNASHTSDEFHVVDTRSDGEFKAGRVPKSTHLEWTHLIADDGRFKSRKQLDALFREYRIEPEQTTVCY